MADKTPKILVVDDEPHQLDTVRRGLFLYGYESEGVQDVVSAIEMLSGPDGDSFDLVLTDLTMPGNSGIHLIEHVQKTKPDLPVIVITGLAATSEIDAVQDKGVPILQKPFEPDGLDKAIRAHL
ncbi:MAG: response regulator [Deltaproteobacteria bacterium]|nr:response regulator [Deltaproteobacteria bacterium]